MSKHSAKFSTRTYISPIINLTAPAISATGTFPVPRFGCLCPELCVQTPSTTTLGKYCNRFWNCKLISLPTHSREHPQNFAPNHSEKFHLLHQIQGNECITLNIHRSNRPRYPCKYAENGLLNMPSSQGMRKSRCFTLLMPIAHQRRVRFYETVEWWSNIGTLLHI